MSEDGVKFPEETVTTLATLAAPWSREVTLQSVDHDSGLRLMRVRIKEGRSRFTIVDLDAPTAEAMVKVLQGWLGK
jgi:hypothetical protein